MLKTLFIEKADTGGKPSISMLKNILQCLSPAQRTLIGNVCQVFQLLMVIPATNNIYFREVIWCIEKDTGAL